MSFSSSGGPPLPRLVPGSTLQTQLQSEGVRFSEDNNNRLLIEHIIHYATPGHIAKVIWFRETSRFHHEYLLMCVKSHNGRLSWIRVERMGSLPADRRNVGLDDSLKDQAHLVVTLAPSRENLICNDDRALAEFDLDQDAAKLVDVARLILIVHNEEPKYDLVYYNCWWLARLTTQALAETFMHTSPRDKKKVLMRCIRSSYKHSYVFTEFGPSTEGYFGDRRKRVMAEFNALFYN
ncbi:hypothetical protein NW762_014425 [Fusarium torreyae]|uniref:Uncharacterized protein n=1 Tax=Fusarium torreyae TaxID=1237075 RepID=A0A9W8V6S2_9HYPO|nr:hypothetical protein NW762_014425 [Fusarium torreyae]